MSLRNPTSTWLLIPFVEQIEARGEAELDQVEREERKVWQSIVGSGYIHPIMHLAQIYIECGDVQHATELQETAAQELGALDPSPAWQGTVRYNLACHYALIGESQKAIAGVRQALELNPALAEWSKQDPDLASIRQELGY